VEKGKKVIKTIERELSLQESQKITITLTEDALLIFFAIWDRKIAGTCWGFEPTALDPSSRSCAYDLSAMANHLCSGYQ